MPLNLPKIPMKTPWLALAASWALVGMPLGLAQTPTPTTSSPALPSLGDAATEDLGVGAERRLGERIMQDIRRDPDVIDDPLLLAYVESLWRRLLGAARLRGELSAEQETHFAFESFLVRDRSINAFALPGGFVGVHLGLINMTGSQDELAAVLAHELSHVTQRHIARSMASNRRQSLVGMAAMILGVMAAARTNAINGANAAIIGGQAAMMQGQLNFSRDMEREADRVGFGVLDQAGFAPTGMMAMFDKLQAAARLDNGQFPYLRSHPLTSERIGEARARLGTDNGVRPLAALSAQRWAHAAMQARARALMDNRAVSQQKLIAAMPGVAGVSAGAVVATADGPGVTLTPDGFITVYAGTLAALQLKDWPAVDQGLQRLKPLSQAVPAIQPAVFTLQVEAALERGRGREAQELLATQSPDGSRNRLLLTVRAAALTGHDMKPVTEALQTWVTAHPGDAQAWQSLGQLQDKQGLVLASLRSQAEARLAWGDLPGAIDRLKAGQRESRLQRAETVDASVLESRLRQLEAKRRQQFLDERGAKPERDVPPGVAASLTR